MPVSDTMPRLGESVTEGTITRWLKQEGDRVEADEPLLEVSTDKVDTEIPAPAAGVLARIVVREDETVEVGSELAIIAGDGESVGGDAPAGSGDGQADAGGGVRAGGRRPRLGPRRGEPAAGQRRAAGQRVRCCRRNVGDHAGPRRVGHRRHGDPLAQGRG
jgi:2-oxoglutarate dehydrogenase E2 component (dihydrolipoamide succinyltransferase)